MTTFTKEQIEPAFDAIPEKIQDMLYGAETERKVQKIGMEAGLLIEQLKTLNSIANFAILGLLAGRDIEVEIKNSLSLTELQSKEIAEKISTEIIAPIDNLKVKLLVEQREKEEKERLEKDNEARWAAEEAEELAEAEGTAEVPSEAHLEIQAPDQAIMLEKAPDVAPENLPIEAESFLPKLIPKVPVSPLQTSDYKLVTSPTHPFEEKMKQVFTSDHNFSSDLNLLSGAIRDGSATEAGAIRDGSATEASPAEVTGFASAPLEMEVPQPPQTNTPSIPPAPTTGNLRHDPYREAVE